MHRALILAFLTACAASSDVRTHTPPVPVHAVPLEVHVDDAFDEPDRGAVLGAVAAWNVALAGHVILDARVHGLTLFEPGILIMRIDSSASYIPTPRPDARTLAFTDHVGGRLVWIVRDRMTVDRVYPVTLHELGHVFGATDRDAPGLMHWSFDAEQYRCIDAVTVAEVSRWLGFPMANGCGSNGA